jgi:hypothetical protein
MYLCLYFVYLFSSYSLRIVSLQLNYIFRPGNLLPCRPIVHLLNRMSGKHHLKERISRENSVPQLVKVLCQHLLMTENTFF